TLNNVGSTFTLNAATGSWRLAGGTIRGGTVVTTDGTSLTAVPGNYYSSTLDGVTLRANVVVANTGLRLDGTWNKARTLTATNSRLDLAGTFAPAALGTFRQSGSTVNLIGTVENVGSTLTLDANTGSWVLYSGTIHGGIVTTRDGTRLMGLPVVGSTGTL